MAPKKRNHAPRSKLLSAAPQTAGREEPSSVDPGRSHIVDSSNQSKGEAPSELDGSSHSSVKLECERALNALRRGNHPKAIRLMKDLCMRYENSSHLGLIYRVQGTVFVKVASIMNDRIEKQRHLKNAVESARKASLLSPNSIEFSHFYANLLYEAVNDGNEYEEVAQECQRALSIEKPVDPAKESLQDESQQKIRTESARIEHVQQELNALIQKSRIASLSSCLKNLGNGEEKIRLIPIRRPPDDPMDLGLVQGRRANEIKKAIKTLEERRKEIEVRVAAARLLQQKSELPQSASEEVRCEDSSPVHRKGERKKSVNARKNDSSAERRDRVRAFWETLGTDVKRDLLRIKTSDLKAHYRSLKAVSVNEVLLEALSYAESNKKWTFWLCCRCGEKFSDAESHMQHVVHEHMGNLLPQMQSFLPQNADNEWIELLRSCSWKPLNVPAAAKIIENQSECQFPRPVGEFNSENCPESKECFKDAWDSSALKDAGDNCNGVTVEGRDYDKSPNIEHREYDWRHGSEENFISNVWPLSEDSERANLLERIGATFDVLIRHKCLAASHVKKLIQFTVDELQSIASGPQLLNHGVDQSPLCMCFLGTSQLNKIFEFLQEVSFSCGLGRYSEKSVTPMDGSSAQASEIDEKISLSSDASYLLLDEHLLHGESISCSHATADSSGPCFDIVSPGNGVPYENSSILSWIYTGRSYGEELASWMHMKKGKNLDGTELLQLLEKEFFHLQNLCERKCEHLSYEDALQTVEGFCLEETKKRGDVPDVGRQSFESVLRKRQEEIEANFIPNNRFELDAVRNVLKEADSLNAHQFVDEEAFSGVMSHPYDLKYGEDFAWRAMDYPHSVDASIETSIQRHKKQSSLEVNKIDAKILRNVAGMQQLELRLEPISAHDYRSILLPLVKSFLRARLEDLSEKDATEKSNAASEAFLAELALDTKKGNGSERDNPKNIQEKVKDKKKNKELRKNLDPKATGGNEQYMLQDETVECIPFPDHPDLEVADSVNCYELTQQEREFKRKLELEAEERKLLETLEYQKWIECEAKQKYLSEKQKKAAKTFPLDIAVAVPDAFQKHDIDDQELPEQQLVLAKQELLVPEEDLPVDLEDKHHNSLEMAPVVDSCGRSDSQNLGLQNGVILKGDVLPSNRRTGRKGKRPKNSPKSVDGRYQTGSSERENSEVGFSQIKNSSKEQVKLNVSLNHEEGNGAKTLEQLHRDDDEERFQADLQKAVRQSLAHQKEPLALSLEVIEKFPEADNGALGNEVVIKSCDGADILGSGLKNEVGEYNCFLNVIIQSLWHLRLFRDEFMSRSASEHVHLGDPCVICALYDIFTALSMASTADPREVVAPTSLRIALSNLYPDSSFFQEAQMNDASEVLGVLFDCLHRSVTSGSDTLDAESVESNCAGFWDCTDNDCIVHSLFGMNIFEQMTCSNCRLESRHMKYTSFFHNVNASALRTMKDRFAEGSFDELLNRVEMNHQIGCDPDAGGCGKLNYIHHSLSASPHIFTIVLGWQNTCESADDITSTLAALTTEIDIGVLYKGLDLKNTFCLVSVVCYYGQHYHCFAYNHDSKQWIMYDDKTVKVIGGWGDILNMCEKGHLQPQVLFFEKL